MTPAGGIRPAFATLERALRGRRFARLDVRLRLELLALALLVDGFVFWQARVPLDGLARASGPGEVARMLALILAGLAALGGALAGARLLRVLDDRAPGPEWLALPLEGATIAGHLARESRAYAAWTAAFAPGYLAAVVGLIPPLAVAGFALGFALAIVGAARLGTTVAAAWRRAQPRRRRATALEDPWLEALAESARPARRRAGRHGRWRRVPRVLALAAKDLLLVWRVKTARARAIAPLALAAASALAWTYAGGADPNARALVRFVAFGLALLAAAALADVFAGLAGLDPFPVLRTLPVGPGHLWSARALWVLAFAVAMAIAHAVAAAPWLAPAAIEVHLVWLGVATVAIGLLGVHYGLTLFPRGDAARRFLGLTLAIAVAASLMIPLLGWIVLLAAVIHSGRKVPRWHAQEETA